MKKNSSISKKRRFRVTILVSNSLEISLSEAVEMQKNSVNQWMKSHLNVEIRADTATLTNFQREAHRGCDLFIFYGHGSKDGFLQFVDGTYDFSRLNEQEFWKSLSGCIIFACHGLSFTKNLPCPWISFSAPILKQAPTGFMSAWISHLKDKNLCGALDLALEMCREEMKSEFPSICSISKNPMPDIRIPSGEPLLSRCSPGLSNKYRLDYVDFGKINISYPEHDPFVGRTKDLKLLLKLPRIHGDEARQLVVWVWGNAGMGKSALIRQFAYVVRDQLFHEHDEPLYLFQMNCWNYTQPRDLEKDLIENLKRFYRIKGEFQYLPEFIQKLEETKGTHVWILDDLTYLSSRIESNEEAVKFIAGIIEAAKVSALTLKLVTSTRHSYPNYHKNWDNMEVLQLSEIEAIELARILLPEDYSDTKLERGANLLFKAVQYSTALYKRSLINAICLRVSYLDYALEMSKTGLENIDTEKFIRRMGTFESSQLLKLEPIHGFRYSEFLKIYYPLATRSSWFSQKELKSWFGSRLVSESSRINEDIAYENGLRYLVRLNYLAAKDQGDGDIVFYMPPNQRSFMRAIRDLAWMLPDSVPLRGVQERLSLCIERIKKGSNTEVQELLEMEQDYRQEIKKPEAANAIFLAMHIRAQIESTLQDNVGKSIEIYDEIVSIFEKNKDEYAGNLEIDNLVATALYNKGATLGKLGKSEEEIVEYDTVVKRFGARDETVLVERVAAALNNKGLALGDLGKLEDAIASYDEVITRCKNRNEALIVEKVVSSLSNKGVILNKLGKSVEALEIYDEIVSQYGDIYEATIAEKVANALYNKGYALDEQGKFEDAIAAFSTIVVRFGGYDDVPIARRVATAMVSIGLDLSKLQRSEDTISTFDDILMCFGDSDDASIADDVARALIGKGIELNKLGKLDEAITTFDDVVTRFGDREETTIIEKVASALNNKGLTLDELGKFREAISVYNSIFAQYGDRDETIIAEKVAMAVINIGIILENQGNFEDSIAYYNLVITRFGNSNEVIIVEKVALALFKSGVAQGKLGDYCEEIDIYDSVIAQFGDRNEETIAEKVAMALYNKGIVLVNLGKFEDAIAAYDSVVIRFGDRSEINLAEKVIAALYNKGSALGKQGRFEDAMAVYDSVVTKFGDRDEVPLAEHVAMALVNKGVILGNTGKPEDAIAVYDSVVTRFGNRNESPIANQVAKALLNKGITLENSGKLQDAILVYDELATQFTDRNEIHIAQKVASALLAKGSALFKLGRFEEEIEVYDLLVSEFGCRNDTHLMELEIMALNNKCETLGRLKRFDEIVEVLDIIINNFSSHSESPIIVNYKRKAKKLRDSIKTV